MRNTLFDLSGKIDNHTVGALHEIQKASEALGIPFFVVGALARDIILKHCYGIEPPRMTRDVDLGVEVPNWEMFNQLKDYLVGTGKFIAARERQRLLYNSMPIDIVPFGEIVNQQQQISWPPEHEVYMSLLGFDEAYEHSVLIRLSSEPLLDVKLPSLPGLAIMKIVAWKEKYPQRKKDAQDLLFIMHNYENAGNFDRLYEEEADLLQAEDYDTQQASIRLLGRDMAVIANHRTNEEIKAILDAETGDKSQNRLIIDMINRTASFDRDFETIKLHIEKLKVGFIEAQKKVGLE